MFSRVVIASIIATGMAGCGGSSQPETDPAPAKQIIPQAGARCVSPSATPHAEPSASPPTEPTTHGVASADGRTLGGPTGSSPPLAGPAVEPSPKPPVLPVYRPSDGRPLHDAAMLAEYGIRTFESKRLRLHTDIDPETARTLPRLIDAAYEAWVEYFGPLPPSREGTEFQITGYLMADKELFRRLGLIPPDLAAFVNGRHRGAQFWVIEQQEDYYRRHLLIHEATHCFMTITPDVRAPVWYMEGMAELFGTHRLRPDGSIEFRVMPENRIDYVGFGRIDMIRNEIAAGRFKSLGEVQALQPNNYFQNEPYAWSWAICKLLDTHPRYRERFRQLGRHLTGNQFDRVFHELFGPSLGELRTDWGLFAHSLQEGYDFERTVVDYRRGAPLAGLASPGRESPPIRVQAARGWQSSGLWVEQGRSYDVTAAGRFSLAVHPKPWMSEPQGVSLRYFDGRPLGMLLATVRVDADSSQADAAGAPLVPTMPANGMLQVVPVGAGLRLTAPATGTLYFRVNDSWSELADNDGTVEVRVRPIAE